MQRYVVVAASGQGAGAPAAASLVCASDSVAPSAPPSGPLSSSNAPSSAPPKPPRWGEPVSASFLCSTAAAKKRRGGNDDGVWKFVKELDSDTSPWPGFTHICQHAKEGRHCNELLKVGWEKRANRWVTTVAIYHMKTEHKDTTSIGANAFNRELLKASGTQRIMEAAGQSSSASGGALSKLPLLRSVDLTGSVPLGGTQTTLDGVYALSRDERQRAAQARFYIYAPAKISKSVFENKLFREMISAGDDHGQKSVVLSPKDLINFVVAEFECFTEYLRFLLSECHDLSFGNAFAQLLHDAGTLVNHIKYEAAGMQLVAPKFDINIVVAFAFEKHIWSNTDVSVADTLQSRVERIAGIPLMKLIAACMSDRAALGVGNELEVELNEPCLMHDGDKLGRAAVGDLTRSRMRRIVNAFIEGQQLLKKARELAVWFSYGKRLTELHITARACQVRAACAPAHLLIFFLSPHHFSHSVMR